MQIFFENNWLRWGYQEHNSLFRQQPSDHFKLNFEHGTQTIRPLREETVAACRSIQDTYPNETLCLLFSGGSESEIMLRSFRKAGVAHEVYIARYENDYNIYDVSHAVVACESMNADYKIIDFNLEQFFTNDAEHYAVVSQTFEPKRLPQMAFAEQVDGIPVMGDGEPALCRTTSDYSVQGTWLIQEQEAEYAWAKYFAATGRTAVPYWCRWTPSLFLSWMSLDWFNRLANDHYPGKLGVHSTKIQGYREQFPELLPRTKKHGFEKIESLDRELAAYLDTKYNTAAYENVLRYTLDEIYEQVLEVK